MSRRWRALTIVAALAILQAAIVLSLRHGETETETETESAAGLRNLEAVSGGAVLTGVNVETGSGAAPLLTAARPTLLHVWASWCAPCRAELPELIAAVPAFEARGVDVILLSVDENWPVIEHYFDGRAPASVRRMNHDEASQRFGILTLPTTLVLDDSGRVSHRATGAQAWTSAKVQRQTVTLATQRRPSVGR